MVRHVREIIKKIEKGEREIAEGDHDIREGLCRLKESVDRFICCEKEEHKSCQR